MNRPNVLVVTLHDTGRHFGCYGDETIHSPNIDALAADGVKFTNLFSTCPVCSPSRASLMTGCHPQTHGVMSLVAGCWNWTLREPRSHLSHRLHDAGYHTRMYGYQDEAADLTDLGFDTSSSYLGPRMPKAVIDAPTMAQDVAGFLREHRASGTTQPFYAQVGFFETHIPFDYGGTGPDDSKGVAIPAYCQSEDPKLRDTVAHFQGSVRKADEGMGILLNALRETGLEDNTIVLFSVDHGAQLPRAKWFMHDAGLGIGFILRWAEGGLAGGRTCDWLLSNMDFVPTLEDWLGLKPTYPTEGVSFAAISNGDSTGPGPRDAIQAMWAETEEYAVRTADYKLIRKFKSEVIRPQPPGGGGYAMIPAVRLFHLPSDPYEQHNVAADPSHAAALSELNQRFYDWLDAVNDPIRQGPCPRRFTARPLRIITPRESAEQPSHPP